MNESVKIYRPFSQALGDSITDLNYYYHLSEDTNEIIKISNHYFKGRKKINNKLIQLSKLMQEEHRFKIIEDPPTEPKKPWDQHYPGRPFIKTKEIWKKTDEKKIAYHFEAISHKYRCFKSKEIEQSLIQIIIDNGYQPIQLGWKQTFQEIIHQLATCYCFIGVDGGIGWLACATGTPIIYGRNGFPKTFFETCHKSNHFILCDDHTDLATHLQETINNQKYYISQCLNPQWLDTTTF